MNGKGLIIAIVTVGVGLGGLILNGQHTTNRAIAKLQEDVSDLRERMARMEGRMDSLESVIVQVFVKREDSR